MWWGILLNCFCLITLRLCVLMWRQMTPKFHTRAFRETWNDSHDESLLQEQIPETTAAVICHTNVMQHWNLTSSLTVHSFNTKTLFYLHFIKQMHSHCISFHICQSTSAFASITHRYTHRSKENRHPSIHLDRGWEWIAGAKHSLPAVILYGSVTSVSREQHVGGKIQRGSQPLRMGCGSQGELSNQSNIHPHASALIVELIAGY